MANLQTELRQIDYAGDAGQGDKIDLLDVLLFFAENRYRILVTTLLGLVAGVAIALWLRPTFTSVAVILPPRQETSSASALMGELGSLAGLGGRSGLSFNNASDMSDMYVGLLESRTIADGLIHKFDLTHVYQTKTVAAARKALTKHATIAAEKDGLISITVKDHDPKRASELANGFVSSLYAMNSNLAITEAAQRRVFFKQQLDQEKGALAKAETAFKNTEEKTGVIQLSGQAESIIARIAGLNAQIAADEVQLRAMKTFATDQNPDLIRIQQSMDESRKQLAALETTESKQQPQKFNLPAGKVPAAALQYSQSLRDLKFHETLYELLANQYESARIDEAKSAPLIQVVDKAIPPEKKSGPPRKLIALGGIFLGLLLGIAWSLMVRSLNKIRHTPEKAAKLAHLRLLFRK